MTRFPSLLPFVLVLSLTAHAQWAVQPGLDDQLKQGQKETPPRTEVLIQGLDQLRFEENKGQVANDEGVVQPDVLYTLTDNGIKLFFYRDGLLYQWSAFDDAVENRPISEATGQPVEEEISSQDNRKVKTYQVRMTWKGSSEGALVTPEQPAKDYTNYYLAHCPMGVTHVKSYMQLVYKDLYPGIDARYYLKDGKLKYDLIVSKGADTRQIQIAYSGAVDIFLQDGTVRIATPLGELVEEKPVASTIAGRHLKVSYDKFTGSSLSDVVTFTLPGNPIASEDFVIDPFITWRTYFGGTGNDYGTATAVSPSGDVFLAGSTMSASGISGSVSPNVVHQSSLSGTQDAFLAKFDRDGARQWATYYGGSGTEYGRSCDVDASGFSYLAGDTGSSSGIATAGTEQPVFGGSNDAFLVKFQPDGARVWGTYLGGSNSDQANSMSVDGSGNAFVAGFTSSSTGIAEAGAYNTLAGASDTFVAKFNSSGLRSWGTYYGGTSSDYGLSVHIDLAGNPFLAGSTSSSDLPIVNLGYSLGFAGGTDSFIAKFDGSSSACIWSTYLGGSGNDDAYGVTTDASGSAYVVGKTTSSSGIALNGYQNSLIGGTDGMLAKFDGADGEKLWGSYEDRFYFAFSCAVDGMGNLYVAGSYNGNYASWIKVQQSPSVTRSWNITARNNPLSASTTAMSIAVDLFGNLHIAGTAAPSNITIEEYQGSAFPYSLGFQDVSGGGEDAMLIKMHAPQVEVSTLSTGIVFTDPSGNVFTSFTDPGGLNGGQVGVRGHSPSGVANWTMYLDGNTSVDVPTHGIADPSGNVYITGRTQSTSGIASAGHQLSYGGGTHDAFLAKYSPAGGLLWATYYGGTGDDVGTRLSIDAEGNVYLAGYTSSSTAIASGGHQNTYGGSTDAFLVKFLSSGQRIWSTYFGGTGTDKGYGLCVDLNGNVYLGGETSSSGLGYATVHQPNIAGSSDGMLAKFSSSGTRLWMTYYGGISFDALQALTVDGANNIIALGQTSSFTGISSVGAFQTTFGSGPYDNFAAKFNDTGTRLWGTYSGSTGWERPGESIQADASGNIYLSGSTDSYDGIVENGIQNTPALESDVYVQKLDPTGTIRLAGTFLGNDVSELTSSIALDPVQGGIWVVGVNGKLTKLGNFHSAPVTEPIGPPTLFTVSNITGNSMKISWTDASGPPQSYLVVRKATSPPSGIPADGTGYSVGQIFGNGVIAFAGNGTSFNSTGLIAGTTYYYTVYSFNGFGVQANYNTTALSGNGTTLPLATEPSAQPTAFTVTNVTETSMTVSYTAAAGSPSYLAIRRQGSAPTGLPVDGATYFLGQSIGDGVVVHLGNPVSFPNTGLTVNTTYHYKIFSFTGSPSQENYRTTSPLAGSAATLATEPVSQPTTFVTSNVTTTGMTVSYTAAPGATSYLIVRKLGGAPTGVPVDGTGYSAGNPLGDGTVAYAGPGISFNDSGLTANTTYYYSIFAFNGSGGQANYKTTGPLTGSQATEPQQPTLFVASSVTTTSMTISYTGAAGSPSYLAIRKSGSAPTGTPVDGTTYTLNQALGDGTVVYVGNGVSFSNSGLTSNTTYYYKIFSFNGSGGLVNYNITSPLAGSQITEPDQPTGFVASNVTANSMTVGFTAASGSPSYLAIRKSGSAPTGVPVDGTTYTLNQALGDGTVVYVGTGLSFNNTGLTSNTTYYYKIFASNGSGGQINYNITSPLAGSQITEPDQPTGFVASSVTTSSMTVSYTGAAGSPSYLAIRKSGSAPTGVPVDGTNYTLNQALGDGTVVYVGAALSFNNTGLTSNTTYYYKIFASNGSGGQINYNITSPLAGSQITEPNQPTAFTASNVTANSMTVGFTAASGSPSYLAIRKSGSAPTGAPADGTTYTLNQALGDGTVVHVGTAISFSNSGLNSNTTYYYSIFSFNGTGSQTLYNSIGPLTGSRITDPGQPTAFVASNVTVNSMTVAFTGSGATLYLAIRKSGSAPTGGPVDGTTYALNDALGGGNVVHVGAGVSFNNTGLSSNTIYHYAIYSANGSGSQISYNIISPLAGSQITEPDQPTAFTTSNVTSNSMTVGFTAASGSPSYLAIRKSGVAPTGVPVDGTTYTLNQPLGDGTVVHVGTGLSFNNTGLTSNTTYYYKIFSFNGTGSQTLYNSSSPLTGNRGTLESEPPAQPTLFSTNTVTDVSMNVVFAPPGIACNGYLAIRKSGSLPSDSPVDGTAYTAGTMIGDGIVAYSGSASTFPNTGLTANTTYFYKIFAYNGSGNQINYRTSSPLAGSRTTLVSEPVAQPTAFTTSNVTPNSMTIGYTAAIGSPSYIVIRKTGALPTGVPVDGTTYTVDQALGDGTVEYIGLGNSFNDVGLSAGTRYHYAVFSFAGTGIQTNYINASPLTGWGTTLAGEPTAQPTNFYIIGTTDESINVGFWAASGSPNYLAIRRLNDPPTGEPVDGTSYIVGQTLGDGVVAMAGSGTTFDDTGLEENSIYFYAIYSYNQTIAGSANYLTAIPPLEGNGETDFTCPLCRSSGTGITASWLGDNAEITLTQRPDKGTSLVLQRSIDGREFTDVTSEWSGSTNNSFLTIDENVRKLASPALYYRIKFVGKNRVTYTRNVILDNDVIDENVKVFPNPASTSLNVRTEDTEGLVSISLHDPQGRPLAQRPGEKENSFDISNLAPGLYGVILNYGNRGMKTVKVVITR